MACDGEKPTCVHVLPGVGRLVDAVARLDVSADARLTHANEDDVGIGFGDGYRADRRAANLSVGDRQPVFPRRRSFSRVRLRSRRSSLPRASLDAGDRKRSSAAQRPDAPPCQTFRDDGIERRIWPRLLGGTSSAIELPRQRPGEWRRRTARGAGVSIGTSKHRVNSSRRAEASLPQSGGVRVSADRVPVVPDVGKRLRRRRPFPGRASPSRSCRLQIQLRGLPDRRGIDLVVVVRQIEEAVEVFRYTRSGARSARAGSRSASCSFPDRAGTFP